MAGRCSATLLAATLLAVTLADIPVHCRHDQIVGSWVLHIAASASGRSVTTCTAPHCRPHRVGTTELARPQRAQRILRCLCRLKSTQCATLPATKLNDFSVGPEFGFAGEPNFEVTALTLTRCFTLFVTAHHVLTLSRSHPVSLFLVLNTDSRSPSHHGHLPHGIFLCQRLTPSIQPIVQKSACVAR